MKPMTKIAAAALLSLAMATGTAGGGDSAKETPKAPKDLPRRVVILKCDDLAFPSPNWPRLVEMAGKKDVKVAIGLIGSTLDHPKMPEKYFEFLRSLKANPHIELWNHGCKHSGPKGPNTGKASRTFRDTGYEYQKRDFDLVEQRAKARCGITFSTFAPPNNTMDDETVKVLNERPQYTAVMTPDAGKLQPKLKHAVAIPMPVSPEFTQVGRPDFARFKQWYDRNKQKVRVMALQYHPRRFMRDWPKGVDAREKNDQMWQELSKTIDLLKADGWTFLLPRQYAGLAAASGGSEATAR